MNARERSRIENLVVGAFLAAMSGAGCVYAVRASLAQSLYHQAKYGAAADHPPGIRRRCAVAHRYYPHNYLFCAWTAQTAYDAGYTLPESDAEESLAAARYWCDKGLQLNFLYTDLRYLKARLLERVSLEDAARYWEEYVDWHFWEPLNHLYLLDLYIEMRAWDRAEKTLHVLEGTKYYGEARHLLEKARMSEASGG